MNTGTNAADSAACANRLRHRFGTWKAIVNADAAAGRAEEARRDDFAHQPGDRARAPVANEKIAVLTRAGVAAGRPSPGPLAVGDYAAARRHGFGDRLTRAAIVRRAAASGRGVCRTSSMANIHSQKKRILRAERERLENRRYTSRDQDVLPPPRSGRGRAATTEPPRPSTASSCATIDKAVKRGALHRNTGARKKSRAARLRQG